MKTFLVFLWNVGMCVQTESAPGSSWDSFFLYFFNFLIQYLFLLCFALITPQSLNSFFDVILRVTLHWSSLRPNRNVDFVVLFFFCYVLNFFFLNECNCRTLSIVHFHCLAISYVCQICEPFCQRYFMIVLVRLYGLCQRSCVKFKNRKCCFLYAVPLECVHTGLAVCTTLTFWSAWALKTALKLSKVVEKCLWGEKVEKNSITHWFDTVLFVKV